MSVPSRSTNTAGRFALFEVMFETCDQFVTPDGSGPQLSDNDGTTVSGNFSGFEWSSFACKGEGEESNRGIARAGDVKNFPSLSWNVMRRFVPLEEHHPMLAERDENAFGIPFFEQRFSSAHQIGIFFRRFVWIAPGDSGGQKSFCAVWFYDRHSVPFN